MNATTIVLLAGWGLSNERYSATMHALEACGYTVYAPEFPGFGKAGPPSRPWGLSDYAVFLKEFIDTRGIANPVFVGHSFGGRVALRYNELYPDTLRALILTGTPGFTPVARARVSFFVAVAKVGKLIFRLPILSPLEERVRSWYYDVVGAREYNRAQGMMKQIFKHIVREPLVPAMKAVAVPTLLVWGSADAIVPVRVAERMNRVISTSQLSIEEGADHGLPYKQPERFAALVHEFLRTLPQ